MFSVALSLAPPLQRGRWALPTTVALWSPDFPPRHPFRSSSTIVFGTCKSPVRRDCVATGARVCRSDRPPAPIFKDQSSQTLYHIQTPAAPLRGDFLLFVLRTPEVVSEDMQDESKTAAAGYWPVWEGRPFRSFFFFVHRFHGLRRFYNLKSGIRYPASGIYHGRGG